jgi:hypothetical protein
VSFRNFKHFNDEAFKEELSSLDWDCLNSTNDVDNLVQTFESHLEKLVNKHAPIVTKYATTKNSPWLDLEVKLAMQTRDRLRSIAKVTGLETDYAAFRKSRNACNILCRRKKNSHFAKLFQDTKNSSGWWQVYHQITGKRIGQASIPELKVGDKVVSEPKDIADVFASSIIVKPEIDTVQETLLTANLSTLTEDFVPFEDFEVESVLANLKLKSSNGLSTLPTKLIKENSSIIAPAFRIVLNKCLELGKFPSQWKVALVTPVLKPGGDKADPNSYRPISVLPNLCKAFEALLAFRLNAFIRERDLLSDHQFGFRHRHSTIHALIDFRRRYRRYIRALTMVCIVRQY